MATTIRAQQAAGAKQQQPLKPKVTNELLVQNELVEDMKKISDNKKKDVSVCPIILGMTPSYC